MSKPKNGVDYTPRLAIATGTTTSQQYSTPSSQIDPTKKQVFSNPISQTKPVQQTNITQQGTSTIANGSSLLPRTHISSAYNPYIYTYSRNSATASQKILESPGKAGFTGLTETTSFQSRALMNQVLAQSPNVDSSDMAAKAYSTKETSDNQQEQIPSSNQVGKGDVFTQNYRVSNTYRPIQAPINPNSNEKTQVPNTHGLPPQQNNQIPHQQQVDSTNMKRVPQQNAKSKLNKSSKSETPLKIGQQSDSSTSGQVVEKVFPVQQDAQMTNSGISVDSPSNFSSANMMRGSAPFGSTLSKKQQPSVQQQQQQHTHDSSSGLRYATAYSSHGNQNSQRILSPKTEPNDFSIALGQNRLPNNQSRLQEEQLQQLQQSKLNGAISQSTLIIKSNQLNSNNLQELGMGRKSQTPKREFQQQIANPLQNQALLGKGRVFSPMRSNQNPRSEKPPVQLTLLPIQAEQPKQVIIPLTDEVLMSSNPQTQKHKKSFSNMDVNPIQQNNAGTGNKDPLDMFLIRDQDTGQVYDIRQIDKIDTFSKTNNQEYFDKLKRRHKNAWQGWWNSKRENNIKLIEAAKCNEFNIVQQLLQLRHERADIKADADFKDESSWASLHYAVVNASAPIINLLIAHDADIDIQNDSEQTPLIIAANQGIDDIVDLLLKAGADANVQDNQQNTALHLACRGNHYKCVQILLDHKHIDCSLRNADKKIACELASQIEIKTLFPGYIVQKNPLLENRQNACQLSKQSTADFISSQTNGIASPMPKRLSQGHEHVLSQSSFQGSNSQKNPTTQNGSRKFQTSDSGGSWYSSFPTGTGGSGSVSGDQDKKGSIGSGQGNNINNGTSNNLSVNNVQQGGSPPKNSNNKQSISSQGSCSSNTLSNGSNFYTSNMSGSGVQATIGPQVLISGSSSFSATQQSQQQPWKVVIHDYPNESIMKLFQSTDSADFQANEAFSSSVIENSTQSMYGYGKEGSGGNIGQKQPQQKQHHKVQSLEMPMKSSLELVVNSGPNQPQTTKVGPESFRIVNQIGRGSFGEVYLVEKKGTNTLYAMKMLHKSKILGSNLTKYALTERNVLSIMAHPFIVKLSYAFQTSKDLFLIMDFMPGGDLSNALQRDKKFSESRARIYLVEILLAIRHLHKNDIIYRDLKPENIVIDSEGHAMLTDFGLSKDGIYDQYSTHSFCGSLAYLAPEMLKRVGHGKAVDYYHLGVLLFEMLTGAPPFFSDSKDDICHNIEYSDLRFPSHVSDNARNLISKLLVKNPAKRLGNGKNDFEEMKKHPFFSGINWANALQRKLKPPPAVIKPIIDSKNRSTPNFMMTMTPPGMHTTNHVNGWSFMNALEQQQQESDGNEMVLQQPQSQDGFFHYTSMPNPKQQNVAKYPMKF